MPKNMLKKLSIIIEYLNWQIAMVCRQWSQNNGIYNMNQEVVFDGRYGLQESFYLPFPDLQFPFSRSCLML